METKKDLESYIAGTREQSFNMLLSRKKKKINSNHVLKAEYTKYMPNNTINVSISTLKANTHVIDTQIYRTLTLLLEALNESLHH